MFGAMLVGAWLLIHQQCCVTGEADSRNRYSLYDPLTRRSALEKNFMRFGRSLWTSADDYNQSETMAKFSFLRFGKSKTDSFTELGSYGRGNEDIGPRATRSDDNPVNEKHSDGQQFDEIKFDLDGFSRFAKAKGNFIRFGRNADNFMRFGRARNNFIRLGRNTENFIRFGRNRDVVLSPWTGKRRIPSISEAKRGKEDFQRTGKNDNFMRFGRYKTGDLDPLQGRGEGNENERPRRRTRSTNENILRKNRGRGFVGFARQKEMDKGGGFIRFGRTGKEEGSRFDDEIQFASMDCKQKHYRLSRVERGENDDDHRLRRLFQFQKSVGMAPNFTALLQNRMAPTIGSFPTDSMEVTLKNFFHFYSILLTKLNAIALK